VARWVDACKKIKNGVRADAGPNPQSTVAAEKPIKGSHGFPEAAARMSLIGWCSDIPTLRLFQNVFFRQWLVVVRKSECLLGCLLSFQLRGSRINPITHGVIFALQSQHRPEVKGKICNKPSQTEFSRHQRRTDGAETMDRCCPLKVQLTRASTNRSPRNPKSTRPPSKDSLKMSEGRHLEFRIVSHK
jgi:hypothetical protein